LLTVTAVDVIEAGRRWPPGCAGLLGCVVAEPAEDATPEVVIWGGIRTCRGKPPPPPTGRPKHGGRICSSRSVRHQPAGRIVSTPWCSRSSSSAMRGREEVRVAGGARRRDGPGGGAGMFELRAGELPGWRGAVHRYASGPGTTPRWSKRWSRCGSCTAEMLAGEGDLDASARYARENQVTRSWPPAGRWGVDGHLASRE